MKMRMEGKFVALGLGLIVTACGLHSQVAGPELGGGNHGSGASELTSVNIGLPDRSQLKSQVADIESKMNLYHLIIRAKGSCPGFNDIDQTAAYTDSPSISASLNQGCDYEVNLALGQDAAGASLTQAYNLDDEASDYAKKTTYEGSVKAILGDHCVSCHQSGGRSFDLTSYAAAKTNATQILTAVASDTMPKSPSPKLAQSDKQVLRAWRDNGFLEKEETVAPPPAADNGSSSDGSANSNGSSSANSGSNSSGSSNSAGSSDNSSDRHYLIAIYYKNNTPLAISRSDIAGKASLSVSLTLQLQPDGEKIGLKAGSN